MGEKESRVEEEDEEKEDQVEERGEENREGRQGRSRKGERRKSEGKSIAVAVVVVVPAGPQKVENSVFQSRRGTRRMNCWIALKSMCNSNDNCRRHLLPLENVNSAVKQKAPFFFLSIKSKGDTQTGK